ncbi:MAG: hypothetical protein LUG49_04495 [Oscillospiraceae bacterium]|nr:hypothetical protein [Oscillospiraceae bacterium]
MKIKKIVAIMLATLLMLMTSSCGSTGTQESVTTSNRKATTRTPSTTTTAEEDSPMRITTAETTTTTAEKETPVTTTTVTTTVTTTTEKTTPVTTTAATTTTEKATSKVTTAAETTAVDEAESISYSSNSVYLPDIGDFLSCGRGEDKGYGDTGHLISYSFSLDNGRDCIDEVIELFQDDCYQLELYNIVDSNLISSTASLFSSYFFSYNGNNSAIEKIDDSSKDSIIPILGGCYDVRVMVSYFYAEGRISISIYYDSDFEMIDPIVRTGNQPTDYSGNPVEGSITGTWDGTYIPEYAKKDCMICNGTGDCQTCGGDGYLWSSASDKENRDCWRCHTHKGKCWACNGTGKQQY